jgi:hypothetical protein
MYLSSWAAIEGQAHTVPLPPELEAECKGKGRVGQSWGAVEISGGVVRFVVVV